MALILQIETATAVCSVSVARDGTLLGVEETQEKNSHASLLHVFTDRLLKRLELDYHDLDAVAVSMGPGSYTGLRIGVSAAKGFCFATGKPLITVNSLLSMAAWYRQLLPAETPDDLFVPMIDARRMEVYTATFNSRLEETEPTRAVILQPEFSEHFSGQKTVHFFGDGASKFREINKYADSHFNDDFSTSSAGLCGPAWKAWNARQFSDLAYFEPYYLKDFAAGIKKP